MKMFCVRDSELAKRDPLGTRLAERGLVARAARACRRCARVALQYSPTHTIVWGTPIRPTYEVADFCALVKESEQAECRDGVPAHRHDRGEREGLRRSPQGQHEGCRLPQDDRRRPQGCAVINGDPGTSPG